jgi:cyclopropane fatty-acyl-phospholipid synthase-like methyltransferase
MNTYLQTTRQNYDATAWWDQSFFLHGISDKQTISSKKNPISAKYHYTSVELQILRHLYNRNLNVKGAVVLDIGAGAGHWIDFYKSLHSVRTIGVDVSLSAVNHLRRKYANCSDVNIYHGKASDVLDELDICFNIVNAIGVMFHIVDDAEWFNTIRKISGLIQRGGAFIVGGHFGYVNGVNVQIDRNGQVYKRLRSKRLWKKTLLDAGFSDVKMYSNNAYLNINDPLPENNICIATK